ncbi:MAG TPA: substrate-binding domain-containing protein [Baekduia sp.]|nr:substrate-binding domain-containing protein [Baekduia sp.]
MRFIESWAKTRRIATGCLLVGAIAALGACGDSSDSSDSGTGPAAKKADATSASEVIANAGITEDTSFCGDKPIKLGIHDAFGVNPWSQYSMAAVRSEAAKCPNVKQVVAIGQGDLQKSLSDINGMVAQGIDALVVVPSLGPGELPAIKAATTAGVKVVPWAATPGGVAGTDYLDYVDWDPAAAGKAFAEWMAKAIKDKGDVVYLGGPAGNPVGLGMLKGFKEVFPQHPGIKLLTGYKDFPAMNWDPALAQKTMAALLAKYPRIDGVLSEDGPSMVGAMRAFTNANRPLVPITALESNGFACTYGKLSAKNPKLAVTDMSGRSWMGRIAARKAIAAAEGLKNTEPSIYDLPLNADTLAGKPPECQAGESPDAFFSNQISAQDLQKYGKVG